ncbi:thiolase domain-containing protein [Candidatus Babeliales bacterium]|nr:thiolase domain-containing protein [Candidatus Babeliales bacterium]
MKIAIIGAACTKFGELWDKSLQDLLAESQLKALVDAKLDAKKIDAIFTGNMCSGMFSGQMHLGGMAAQILNTNCQSTTIEGACASGSLALRAGIMAIESGQAEVVMVNGVEKMTDLDSSITTTGLMGAGNHETEHFVGATFPGLNALIARIYMNQFGLTREELASVSVKNHKHGALNPNAHFQKEITIQNVINSQIIADPLTIFDCPPISDGAASLILSTEKFAQKHAFNKKTKIIYIIGSGQASDTLNLSQRESFVEFKASQLACKQALEIANIKIPDINVAEIHDGFSIMEIISLEDIGFFKKGEVGKATQNNLTTFGSKIVINPSGGLKAKGHPVGATGLSQAYEIVMQLRQECDKRQVKNANFGLTHNVGGCATTSVVHIFAKE